MTTKATAALVRQMREALHGFLNIVGDSRMPMWRRLIRRISAPSPWY